MDACRATRLAHAAQPRSALSRESFVTTHVRFFRYYYDKNIMTKVHGKRYAYKFDFQGLAAATQPAAADPAAYKYQSELFMSGYGHAKLNLMPPPAASVSVSVPGGLFQSASSYWSTSPGANLYAGHHTASGHVPPHLGTYPHYA